ncbi:MAG: molybdopterin-dependent oxidoreductase [Candidatus Binatia bacterium]
MRQTGSWWVLHESASRMTLAFTRRAFLKVAGTTALPLSLRRLSLRPARADPRRGSAGRDTYRSWEDLYRQQWRWDAVVRGTHLRANCLSACAWDVYVKDGMVWREEQAAIYQQTNPSLPDFNPRGCQKGACYSALMYSPARLKYPLRRLGARGSGRWQRISWDQAFTEIADVIIDTCLINGSECVIYEGGTTNVGFGPDTAAEMRFFHLLGATTLDSNGAGVGDVPMGAVQTWGMGFVDGTADDWMHADILLVWCMNPTYTRIPDAHFLTEARYHGTRLVVLTPDYNATAMHADLWLNPKVGTDTALALAMAQVILDEKLFDADYVKEQTDLPFLVRVDTGRLLREQDLRHGGRADVFYFWDAKRGRPRRAPGTQGDWSFRRLTLGDAAPPLEGKFEVTLREGRRVVVRPVCEIAREHLATCTPQWAESVSGVRAELITRLARQLAAAKRAMIVASYGACKHYHSDLLHRALILLLALTGNQGRRGGGLRVAAWWSMSGFETLAGAYEPPFYIAPLLRWFRPPTRTIETYLTKMMRQRYLFTPTLLWLAIHGGLSQADPAWESRVKEALGQRWMPVFPRPGQDPQVLVCTGGNPLRRWPAPHIVEKHLWPKLRLVVSADFRLSTTALKSDIVLPAAGYYEKRGIKYAQSYLPYVVAGDKAVEPLAEAKSEWEIFGLLARRLQERAVTRAVEPYRDALDMEHDLTTLYQSWSSQGAFPVEDEEKALERIVTDSEPTKGLHWAEVAKKGAVPIRALGMYNPVNGVCSDFVPGQTVSPSQWFVEHKEPWPTLTGRQQFYLDHPWFLSAGEELPCYKALPAVGGRYPLSLTGGHTRWSIHAIWRDERHMLRLQRGTPVMYMNPTDAAVREIADHNTALVQNDSGNFRVSVKLSPAVQPGQVIIYHAWEPYQFADWQSSQNSIPSPLKSLHLVGDYGQLHYRTGLAAPCYCPRGTRVQVTKVAEERSGQA